MALSCDPRILSFLPTSTSPNVRLDTSHKKKRRSSTGHYESVSFQKSRNGSSRSSQNTLKVERSERRVRLLSGIHVHCSSPAPPPGPPADGSHGERFAAKSADGPRGELLKAKSLRYAGSPKTVKSDRTIGGSDGGDGPMKKASMAGCTDGEISKESIAEEESKKLESRPGLEGRASAEIQAADVLDRGNQNINGSAVGNGAAVSNGAMNGDGVASRSSHDNGSAGHLEPPLWPLEEHNGAAIGGAEEVLPFQSVTTSNGATSKSLDHVVESPWVARYLVVKEGADSVKGTAGWIKLADMPTPSTSTSGVATLSHDNGSATAHTKAADREPAANIKSAAPAARSVDITSAVATELAPPLVSQAKASTNPKRVKLKPAPSIAEGDAMVLHIGQSLRGKKILITGATGFLAKVLVDTILRTEPDVGRIYLLIRGRNSTSTAQERLETQVINQPVFRELQEKYGDKYKDFMMQKLIAVCGNIEKEGLGMSPEDEEMLIQNVDIIVNSAATTTFDERYDVALRINTKGPLHMIQFAKKCSKLPLFAHVSTAYVNGKRRGESAEMPFAYGQSLIREIAGNEKKGRMKVQILSYTAWSKATRGWLKIWKSLTEIFVHSQLYKMMQPHVAKIQTHVAEVQPHVAKKISAMVEKVLETKKEGEGQANKEELIPALDPEQEIKLAEASAVFYELQYGHKKVEVEMKMLGKRRANEFGWQDTYVFTKAMGEQMLMKHKGDIPVVIIRPSVVESTSDGPVKGWIEGNRMLDPIVMTYARGQMGAFLVDPETILDIIPADIVANTILAVLTKHAGYEQMEPFVYQVASSSSNPLKMRDISRAAYAHFKNWPFQKKGGDEVIIKPLIFITSELVFKLFIWFLFKLPLMLAKVPLKTPFRLKRILNQQSLQHVTHMAEIYKPYVFYKGRFRADNSEKILCQICEEEQESFGYSVKDLDWPLYLMNIHFVGLRQFVYNWRGTRKFNPDWNIYLELPGPRSEDGNQMKSMGAKEQDSSVTISSVHSLFLRIQRDHIFRKLFNNGGEL